MADLDDKKDKRFLTTHTMLEWQYFQILGELQELQRHDSDPTCPCRLSDDLGENCLAKHSLGLSVLAAETAAMETDKKNASLLWELSADAKDRHMKIKGFLCHENDGPEFGDWSRQWRKKIEPVYYHQSCKVKVKDSEEAAPLEDAATDKIESQTFGIKMAVTELSSACPEHAGEKSYIGIAKELNKRADAIDKIVEDLMSRPTVEPVRAATPSRPVSAAPTKISGPIDNTFAFGITTSQRYIFQWKIVDAKDLIVSHDPFTFALNPKFTARLQPRKRERAAYQLQVRNIAGALNPDQLIVDTHTIDTGSPIIGDKDNLVECGNGRVIALLIAAKDFPDRIAAYKKRLKEIAPSYGLPTTGIDKMAIPVLVRARLQPMTIEQRQAFAEECNGRATAAVSAIDKAKSYADKITPGMLNGLIVLENETIFQALKAIRNKDFVISFLKAIPPNDRGEFVDAKGEISQDGTRLIATAIFVNVFKGERGLAIATKFFESSDPDMLTVFSGITRSLTGLAQAESLVASGARQKDYAFSEDLAKVIEVYSTI